MLSTLSKVTTGQQCSVLLRPSVLASLSSSHQSSKQLSGSTTTRTNQSTKKSVFISQSTDIYSNLAFEAWLYKNWSFSKSQLLLLWRNAPCVVIGRHQNPYTEVNLPYIESASVPLARRHSGGGAVYHDHGNLNCSFFSSRQCYNRRWNLEFICQALRTDFDVNVQLNSRDDILLNENLKISGSAAKLGRETAYHHCTLLINTEQAQLNLTLKGDKQMKSNATESVPSSVGNLSSASKTGKLTVEQVLSSLASQYLDAALPNQQHDPALHRLNSNGITLINPQDDWFPGLGEMREELLTWEWQYGRTPRFRKTVEVPIPEYLSHGHEPKTITVEVKCERGLVQEVKPANGSVSEELHALVQRELCGVLRGTPYTLQLPVLMERLMAQQHQHAAISTDNF